MTSQKMAAIVGGLQYFRALVPMEIKFRSVIFRLRKKISSSNQQVWL